MWFDSHCHLHLCASDDSLDAIVGRAHAAGVLDIVTVGIDITSSARSVEIASKYGVMASVGVHPNFAREWTDSSADALRDLLAHDRVVAVGESGLDFYRDHAPHDVQRKVFSAHIALAKESGKALIIHTRDSVDAAIDQLAAEGPPDRVVFHCWSGNTLQLTAALDLGAYISFAGNVSFKNAGALRDAAVATPHDRLLVETDSPFLAPEPHRGKTNEPRLVPFVGVAVAEARGTSAHALAEQTTNNARMLFG